MPNIATVEDVILSPAEMVLDMVSGILEQPKMDVHEKLGLLRELCLERITFESPEQAVRIISMLAEIVLRDPNPEVRVAALTAMERMIGLEKKAEAEGKPTMDWHKVNVLLREAKKQTELDTIPVAARSGAPSPESPEPIPANGFVISANDDLPEAHALSRDDNDGVAPAEAALLTVQENAVAAVKQADVPVVPPSANMLASGPAPDNAAPSASSPTASRPSPTVEQIEQKPEPPIMKFLRSVADTDDQDHIRELASRIITKIENITALKPPTPSTPPTEG